MSEPVKQTALGLASNGSYALIRDEQIQELASLVAVSDKVTTTAGETYLRTMVVRLQQYMKLAMSGETPYLVLDKIESPMYDAVKKGSLTSDIVYNPLVDGQEARAAKAKEHNRRCNWARSIKSELKGALKAGVLLHDIDPFTTSKKKLRDMKTKAVEASVGMPSRSDVELAIITLIKSLGVARKARASGQDVSPYKAALSDAIRDFE